MAIQNINTLKNWFKRGFKPLQQQFYDWMDSFWHKNEKIPIATIDGLESILNTLPSQDAIGSLVTLFVPEVFTTTSNFVYTLKAGRRLQSVILIPSVVSNIRIGLVDGGEDVMVESAIQANETFILDCAAYAIADMPIYINGITDTTQILIYKR
jgi:hypothetical protein